MFSIFIILGSLLKLHETSPVRKPENRQNNEEEDLLEVLSVLTGGASAKMHCGNGVENRIQNPMTDHSAALMRSKRGVDPPNKFQKTRISWFVMSQSFHLSSSITNQIVTDAFRVWESVSPLTFYQDSNNPDIVIRFGSGLHGDCPVPFDEAGSQLGHSWTMGEVHINDAVSLLHPEILKHIAVHELGHALGLEHIEWNPQAIMFSVYYNPSDNTDQIKLTADDIHAIQSLYGECENMDVRAVVELRFQDSFDNRYLVTSGNEIWTSSESTTTSTRVASLNHLLPSPVAAVLQLGRKAGYRSYVITQSNEVFLLDTSRWKLVSKDGSGHSYPQMLEHIWPCFGDDENVTIQTAYYNRRDRILYFYSGHDQSYWVYRYNLVENRCLERLPFSELHSNGRDTPHPTAIPTLTPLATTPGSLNGDGPNIYSDYDTEYDPDEYLGSNLIKADSLPKANRLLGDLEVAMDPSQLKTVYQEHKSQETFIVDSVGRVWRVKKLDYSLELYSLEMPSSWQVSKCTNDATFQ